MIFGAALSLPALTSSFGVLVAFILFCALFAKKGFSVLFCGINTFQLGIKKEIQEAETLLTDAQSFLKDVKKEGKVLALKIDEIEQKTQSQLHHIDRKRQQNSAALLAQQAVIDTAHLKALKKRFDKNLLSIALHTIESDLIRQLNDSAANTNPAKIDHILSAIQQYQKTL